MREVGRAWGRAIEVSAEITGAPAGANAFFAGETVRAIALTELVGPVKVGDELRIDCSALAKSLGTGGYATVIANMALPADEIPARGHIVKARYMPHQHIVQSVEEPDSVHHEVMQSASDLEGVPVLVADLHSAVPAVVAGIRSVDRAARIAYVWDDTAALPLAFSMQIARMREAGDLQCTITSGQSFGGDLEVASMPSALLAARHVAGADYIVVAQGPGNLGTATRWGFSGTATAQALHVAHALGAAPLPVVRASSGDPRPEHLGISHHTVSVLADLVLVPLDVPVPTASSLDINPQALRLFEERLEILGRKHRIHRVEGEQALAALELTNVPLRTMGRGLEQDILAFTAPSAAGIYAASLSRTESLEP
ncbi:MAG: DUF3866 family protein [Actinomycetaceae bacterium]|nr:DUF3866 family protein [Actinomycetaceae bacterium]